MWQIARDDANLSKGYGFVSFSNFEASDDAIANMNGQYLMNKEVSVQYAYKKDGKGERHGDQAERMLAAQARKHNVQPQTQPLPPQLLSGGPPMAPAAMADGDASRPMDGPPGFGAGRGAMANGGYQTMAPHQQPPPQQHHHPQQQQQRPPFPPQQQLATPPPGLPARPPPSQVGYGGPQAFVPPGFNGQPQSSGFTPGGPPPGAPGQGPAPPGGPPQGGPPPGFGSPAGFAPPAGGSGAPPQLPPGFQQPGYGRGR